jgi:hypothetical protein
MAANVCVKKGQFEVRQVGIARQRRKQSVTRTKVVSNLFPHGQGEEELYLFRV